MPEAQETRRRSRKTKSPPEPPAKVVRYQSDLAKRAKETGKTLDQLAEMDALKALENSKPEVNGEWFRIAKAALNGVAYCALEKLTYVNGRTVVERLHGPDVREVCVQRMVDEFGA